MTHLKPLLLASLLAAALPGTAFAQAAWPGAKPITLIVPYSAGGSVDYNTRLVATKLGERLKHPRHHVICGFARLIRLLVHSMYESVQDRLDGVAFWFGLDGHARGQPPVKLSRLTTGCV